MTQIDSAARPFTLGFLAFVEHDRVVHGRSQAIDDGLALFEFAEELGYDIGYVRARHLESYLSSPLPFLAAVAGRTQRLRLGTAVIPVRYEDPLRLAEDASTVDLLSGGRLELGFSGGYADNESVFGAAFGPIDRPFAEEADHRLQRFRSAIAGETLTVADERTPFAAAGAPLRAEPQSPGLADRIYYGAGRLASARRAGEIGVHLQLSTLSTDPDDDGFEQGQFRQIEAYRAARGTVTDAPGIVSVSRQVLPILDDTDAEDLRSLVERSESRQAAYGNPGAPPIQFGVAHSGHPDAIAEALQADVALQAADQLVLALPFGHDDRVVRRVLETFATRIAPQLEWAPVR